MWREFLTKYCIQLAHVILYIQLYSVSYAYFTCTYLTAVTTQVQAEGEQSEPLPPPPPPPPGCIIVQ